MADNLISTNVLIVGAGPAGCAASFFLSKKSIAHVLIDKSDFPRDKICGDAISGKSIYVIRTANEAWLKDLMHDTPQVLPSSGLTFYAPNGHALSIPFGKNKDGYAPGFTSTRYFFDDFLFKKIDRQYASVFTACKLVSLEKEADGWQAIIQTGDVLSQIKAQMLIAADGDKSIVRKMLGLQEAAPKTSAVGLRAYYSGVEGLSNNQIELHFLPELLPGYFWIFPMPGGKANVGVGMLSKDVRDKKINLRERMLQAIDTNPAIRDRFRNAALEGKIYGWGLPMAMTKAALSGNGYILTGDAAHLIDPFSGEGIGNALYSGMRAAIAAEAALENNDFSAEFLKLHYDVPVYKRLWGELRTSSVLQRLCRYPWLFNIVVNKANKSPTLKSTITGMFTDLDLRKKLREPGFYVKMIFNK